MELCISNRGLRMHESAAFAVTCGRHGVRPHQFHVAVAYAIDHTGAASSMRIELIVIHKWNGCRRRYGADFFSSGLHAFETDLRNHLFSGWDRFHLG